MIFKHFSEPGKRAFISFGEYFEDTPRDVPLISLLGLNTQDLKPFTKNLLDSNELSEDIQALLRELSRGMNALFQFQDILDVSLDADGSILTNRHYLYYESLVYLRESVVSWLDKNVLAGLTLLRPFLELSVLYLYWHLRCRESSFKPYYDWLTHHKGDRGKPSFKSALNHVLDNVPVKGWVQEKRLQELKQVIQNLYRGLCTYHHAPKMDESITAASGGFGSIALESFLYYLHSTTILLRQVVYLFILTYPMSLFPVEKHEKWGFSKGPVGLFFDKLNYSRLETYIGVDNVNALRQSFSNAPDVESLTKWFHELPTLNREEIDKEWEQLKRENPGLRETNARVLPQRLAVMKAFNRSLGWAMNYISERTQNSEIPDEVAENLRRRLRNW